MLRQDYEAAHECLQETVYIEPKCPSFWISISILFFTIKQYRDSLDALATSLRLNPFHYEAWYNLGVLVSYEVSSPGLQTAC
jgi:tetratricopeptide (TPR) repeat protein